MGARVLPTRLPTSTQKRISHFAPCPPSGLRPSNTSSIVIMDPSADFSDLLDGPTFGSLPWPPVDSGYSTFSYPHTDTYTNGAAFLPTADASVPPGAMFVSMQGAEMQWTNMPVTTSVDPCAFAVDQHDRQGRSQSSSQHSPASLSSPASSHESRRKRNSCRLADDEGQATSGSRSLDDKPRPKKRTCSETHIPADIEGSTSTKPKAEKRKSKSEQISQSSLSALVDGGAGGTNRAHLRTASRRPKGTPPGSPNQDPGDEDLTPEERRARHSHNMVEKQYRNRLNQQFESLLAVLPAESQGSRGGGEGDERRLSKAEVLDMARQRITTLEEERRTLQLEREELLENVGLMGKIMSSSPNN
ncbi:hypothetical protein VTK73DRAFT_6280 [Phialemonium thermophilum]|uniref:BHLH domain-containing protein n=1 Tax=Phialemonium thermophilum TaxID=223376 RepID=A0ABR3WK62_9PEZI